MEEAGCHLGGFQERCLSVDIVDQQEARHLQRKTALVQDEKNPVLVHQAVGS